MSMNRCMRTLSRNITLLFLIGFTASAAALDVSILDTGLNAAVFAALHKSAGPITQQDMLSLTNLDASRRAVRRIDGLETALNLVSLNLQINVLTNVAIPGALTKLANLNLSANSLTNCIIPNGLTNLGSLVLEANSLRKLTLPRISFGCRTLIWKAINSPISTLCPVLLHSFRSTWDSIRSLISRSRPASPISARFISPVIP